MIGLKLSIIMLCLLHWVIRHTVVLRLSSIVFVIGYLKSACGTDILPVWSFIGTTYLKEPILILTASGSLYSNLSMLPRRSCILHVTVLIRMFSIEGSICYLRCALKGTNWRVRIRSFVAICMLVQLLSSTISWNFPGYGRLELLILWRVTGGIDDRIFGLWRWFLRSMILGILE